MKNRSIYVLACFMLALAIIGAGCVSESKESPVEETVSEPVTLGIIQWDDSRANSQVFKQILEAGGYEVEVINADVGGLYQAAAQGDIDAIVGVWLPITQKPYWDKYGEDLDYVTNVSTGAKCGLVVPEYVTIDTIEELNANADKFDGIINGIEPGSGIMQSTEKCFVDYEMDNFELYSSSTVGMVTELQSAIDNEEWIVVTLWRPHWSFARMDGLKFLEDTEGVYGENDNLAIVARKDFQEDRPEIYEIMKRYNMDLYDIESMMIEIDNGKSAEQTAADWLAENPEKIDEVLGNQ
ncbi:glycine betaine ABC transporter substrate-binding protein [Methanococcoides orientis]|uniref:glycine betaine ABC transporter substrate-binding protein n=1 Tax=Methanococcoides orientis TaxID=2822137 RepID=UPI001E59552B|nr:glycine betaine ABC transporter substrate-binding protein [Methanococcoides orientis]UGV41308.1 glycine betaine ABC transporter substrate-binding protein [Methanococcoides orientis]